MTFPQEGGEKQIPHIQVLTFVLSQNSEVKIIFRSRDIVLPFSTLLVIWRVSGLIGARGYFMKAGHGRNCSGKFSVSSKMKEPTKPLDKQNQVLISVSTTESNIAGMSKEFPVVWW